jgi:hypothetical protein
MMFNFQMKPPFHPYLRVRGFVTSNHYSARKNTRQLSMIPTGDINVYILTISPRHYLEELFENISRLLYNQLCQNNLQAPLSTLTEPLLLDGLPDVASGASKDSVLKLQVLTLLQLQYSVSWPRQSSNVSNAHSTTRRLYLSYPCP